MEGAGYPVPPPPPHKGCTMTACFGWLAGSVESRVYVDTMCFGVIGGSVCCLFVGRKEQRCPPDCALGVALEFAGDQSLQAWRKRGAFFVRPKTRIMWPKTILRLSTSCSFVI